MSLRSCIVTLMVVYPVVEAAGVGFFLWVAKTRPHKNAARNRRLTVLRFLLYVVLMPVGVTIAMGVLGWLDPLFHLIGALRR